MSVNINLPNNFPSHWSVNNSISVDLTASYDFFVFLRMNDTKLLSDFIGSSTPGSYNFGKEYTYNDLQEYLPDQSAINAVMEELQKNFSSVTSLWTPEIIKVTGTVGQVQNYFQTSLKWYQLINNDQINILRCDPSKAPFFSDIFNKYVEFVTPINFFPNKCAATAQASILPNFGTSSKKMYKDLHGINLKSTSEPFVYNPAIYLSPDLIRGYYFSDLLQNNPDAVFPSSEEIQKYNINQAFYTPSIANGGMSILDVQFYNLFANSYQEVDVGDFGNIGSLVQETAPNSVSNAWQNTPNDEANLDCMTQMTAAPLVPTTELYMSGDELLMASGTSATGSENLGAASSPIMTEGLFTYIFSIAKQNPDKTLYDLALPQVVSISWGGVSQNYTDPIFLIAINREFMKLGLMRMSIFAAAGDTGIQGAYTFEGDIWYQTVSDIAELPSVTVVGYTYVSSRSTTNAYGGETVAQDYRLPSAKTFLASCSAGLQDNYYGASGAGASVIFDRKKFLPFADKVMSDFAKYPQMAATLSTINNQQGMTYDPNGRFFPDVSLLGTQFMVPISGKMVIAGGSSMAAPLFAGLVSLINLGRRKLNKPAMGYLLPFLYANIGNFYKKVSGDNTFTQGLLSFPCVDGLDYDASGLGDIDFVKMYQAALEY